jgi:hypothetical protein
MNDRALGMWQSGRGCDIGLPRCFSFVESSPSPPWNERPEITPSCPHPMRAFLSSTFRDLKFERRFVIHKLKKMGIDVVSMETDCKEGFDWARWSTNQAGQCDLFISLFDKIVGTQGNLLFGDTVFHSISKMETDHARGAAIKLLEYRLQRPFPDQEVIFTAEEKDEYLKTVVAEDGYHELRYYAAQTESLWREGTLIESVAELERRLEVDTRVSLIKYFVHKMRIIYRSYFNQNLCAWRHAFEDESLIESTTRLGLSWRLRKLAIISLIPFAVLYFALPLPSAIFCSAMLILFMGATVIAYRPSFIWVGTKTIMARGPFGRLVQRSIHERFQLKSHWALLDYWTGLGALSVHFADGARVFVPLVNDPVAFVRELPTKMKEREERRGRRSYLTAEPWRGSRGLEKLPQEVSRARE